MILFICQCIILTVEKIHLAGMEKMIAYFRKHGGYALMKELKAASFQTRDIARLLKEGTIIKVKPGLYRLANLGDDGDASSQDKGFWKYHKPGNH